MQMGFVGTKGIIDIEDTHRDVIIVSDYDQGKIYRPKGREVEDERFVDFLTSYPPGDIYKTDLWGPMKDETFSWLQRICMGTNTPHTSAHEAHRNLMYTLAMDLSAKLNKEIDLDISEDYIMDRLNLE
jgi:myo-inositol 2-dehydrogenase/D-chiro-inositol 1-dehydrogenase